jgi:MFS family permease
LFRGLGLDGMDFMIYPLVIGTIITLWDVSSANAGLASTMTLLASAFGGSIAGYMSDRIGRTLTLQITVGWFSFFSLVCAFVQDFNQLLIARTLLGLGFGGEWAVGSILMGEMVRAISRARVWLGAVGVGDWRGHRRDGTSDHLLAAAGRGGVALDVRARRLAGAADLPSRREASSHPRL